MAENSQPATTGSRQMTSSGKAGQTTRWGRPVVLGFTGLIWFLSATGGEVWSQTSPTPHHQAGASARPARSTFLPALELTPPASQPREALWLGQDPYGAALPPTAAFPANSPQIFSGLGNPGYDPASIYANGTAQVPGGNLSYFSATPSLLGQGSNFADLDVYAPEGQTGRFMFGGAYNSDMGLMGQIILDERNFDIRAFPRSFRDIVEGRAFRGGGQRFRMELVPGNELQRYMVSLTEPFLFDTNVSFGISGFYFTRRFFDYDEQRLGGRLSLGYRLTPDLTISAAVRAESVDIKNPRLLTSPQLNNVLGNHDFFMGSVTLTHDTRDHPFMPTEGRFFEIGLSQGFGSFDFPRADLDWRRYFLMYQRPDRSGRHTVSIGTRLGFSGSDTPMFENYFAGGFSTMRGFDFRGASPVENGVVVGGRFQWLNTVEYTFPITADDMIKGVAFVDYGTVEPNTQFKWDSFRVAPGLGLRIHMPAGGGGGAPLAFDFAVPINRLGTDDTNIFSFYMGFVR
jgi:outer membrane protein insertion porin family